MSETARLPNEYIYELYHIQNKLVKFTATGYREAGAGS